MQAFLVYLYKGMHQTSKNKLTTLRRVIAYVVMLLAIAVVSTILIFYMLGYRFNRADGKIEQGALVQFNSQPSGANVRLDQATLANRTPSKVTVTTGDHTVAMSRDRYRSWQKAVTTTPGQLLWLSYARLIPEQLSPSQQQQLPVRTSTQVSSDRRWLAAADQTRSTLQFIDISGDKTRSQTATIPDTALTPLKEKQKQVFTIAAWANDNKTVLIKRTIDGRMIEWLVLNREDPAATVNLNMTLGVNPTTVLFSANNAKRLYALIDGNVRSINLDDETLSRPLVPNVAEFSLYENTILYVSKASSNELRTVGYLRSGAEKPRVLRTVDDPKVTLKIDAGAYFGSQYVAIANGETVEVLKGELADDNSSTSSLAPVTTLVVPAGVQYVSFQTQGSGRFVIVQGRDRFTTYDIELKKTTTTKLANAYDGERKLQWIDNFYAVSDRGGMMRLYEFDGANQNDIMSVLPGQVVTLNPDGKYLYGVTRNGQDQTVLSRVQLRLD